VSRITRDNLDGNRWKIMRGYAGLWVTLVAGLALLGPVQAAEDGLVAHLTFDEGSGEIARDLTGNGHDGVIAGPEYVKSPRGYALSFDGVDDTVIYSAVESMILTGDMTLMVWIKTDAHVAAKTNRMIFGDTGYGVERNLNLRLSCYGQLMFEWADGERNAYLTADANLLDGAWRHVTVVCDSAAMRATMYVDGEQVAGMRMPLPISKAPVEDRMTGVWAGGCLDGELDEVRLYDRALPASEVRAQFEAQAVVQVSSSHTSLEMADGVPRAQMLVTLRNWTDEPKQARIETRAAGAETVDLPAGESVQAPLGHADLQPLFAARTDLYLVTTPPQAEAITVSVDDGGEVDTQELAASARAYLEPISLQVRDPWRRRMAPGKTGRIVMQVQVRVAEELRVAGRLNVTLTSRLSGEVAARRTISAPEPETQVIIDAGRLPWGAYDVRAALVDGEGREIVATDGLATVLPGGKQHIEVLNNLCSELMNTRERGLLADREIEFMNPRDGWCFFSLEGRASLRLDGETVALSRDAAEVVEAMRLLPAGRHTVTVAGDATQVIVRAIPALVHNVYPTSPRIRPFGPHTWERLARYTLPNCNMIESHETGTAEAAEWVAQGKSWIMNRTAPGLRDKSDQTAEEILEYWRATPGWGTDTFSGMQVDEYGPGFGNINITATAVSAAMLADDPEFAGKSWIPFVVRMHGTDATDLFMKTTMAAGWPFSIERYVGELATEAEDREHIDAAFVGTAEAWEGALPGSMRHAIFTLMYAYLPYCTTNRFPTADFRVHLQMQMETLATHPSFFGLWGVQPYRSNYVDEEILNCMGALLRHYCIEGRTDPLLSDPYELRHVANPDFGEGVAHWDLAPAEEGAITTGEFAGYGQLQGRYPWSSGGESFLVTKRSAAGPNAFSQEIVGLQPGRLYSLKMITADHQDLLAGESVSKSNAVSIRVDGAEVMDGGFAYPFYSARGPNPFTRDHPFHMNYHWLQFRATDATARLTVTDWQSDDEPGSPIGQELMFSFIEIQPVFETQ
jgi:hypothetical protein